MERVLSVVWKCKGGRARARPEIRRKRSKSRAYSRARSACSITVGTTSTIRGGFGQGFG
jgi:hypothetical protein